MSQSILQWNSWLLWNSCISLWVLWWYFCTDICLQWDSTHGMFSQHREQPSKLAISPSWMINLSCPWYCTTLRSDCDSIKSQAFLVHPIILGQMLTLSLCEHSWQPPHRIIYFILSSKEEITSSHHKKKKHFITMVIDLNWTYCGDYFTINMNIKLVCCTPNIWK